MGATGNASFGYFAGGGSGVSTIDRLEYSNDTTDASPKGNLSVGRYGLAGSSSQANAITVGTLFPASSVRDNVAPQGTDFGYFGGGTTPTVSTVDRVDYASDTLTALVKGPLSSARRTLGATGNGPFGYFGGGEGPSEVSTIDRIDYSNDTVAAPAKGPLSSVRRFLSATGNSDFGYFGGGFPGPVSTVDRLDYSNDTADAVTKGPLSVARYRTAATGNASFGYFAGGAGPKSTVDRIDYSNDTATAVAKGSLSGTRYDIAATGNADFGYFGGGASPKKSTVDRIDYSNDTVDAPAKGPLSSARYGLAATGNSSLGYFGGGESPIVSTVDRVDYSNDTATAAVKGPLSSARRNLAASSSRANAIPLKGPGNLEVPVSLGAFSRNFGPQGTDSGYFAGGYVAPAAVSTVARIDYSSDTFTLSSRGPLSLARIYAGNGVTSSASGGYFGGGSPSNKSTVQRIDYSNDTADASVRGPLVNSTANHQAVGNALFGYFNGGSGWDPSVGPVYFTSSQRIDYSNDTATAVVKGNLNNPVRQGSGTGNQDFGYFGGGMIAPPSPYISSVERVDYSNDTVTAVAKGSLTAIKRELGATGNADFGYFGGGYNAVPGSNNWISNIDRIDYSNDTAAASPKGPLSRTRGFGSATGNSSFGYFGGGAGNNSDNLSLLDRVDYSNDTATTVDKGPLSYSLRNSGACSSRANAIPTENIVNYAAGTYATPNTGYIAGGHSTRSTVQRIDYSNDTATAVEKGSLNTGRSYAGATSSSSFGYVGGGNTPSDTSSVERVDYSNDTVTTLEKGPLSLSKSNLAGVGNQNYGYFGGGSPNRSKIDRIDYSNDTATASPKGRLDHPAYNLAATGNADFGYFAGGQDNPGTSNYQSFVERRDYSNDTADTVQKGPLSLARIGLAASGNSDFGYFGGGDNPSGNEVSTVDRVDFSNDTATASAKGPLSQVKYYLAATGDTNFGYVGGGFYPGKYNNSVVDRIDYSNDTATATVKGPLAVGKYGFTATSVRANGFGPIVGPALVSNADAIAGSFNPTTFGYFGGNGGPKQTTVDRIDYSNDTAAASPKGSLSSNVENLAATGNSFFGYFGGGDADGTPGYSSKVDRLDYSNDTSNALTRGPLNHGRKGHSATGNSDFGYFITGQAPSNSSYIDRVDYSNDLAEALTRGNNEFAQFGTASTGNQDFGYVGGGSEGSYAHVSRIDYANDGIASIDKGNLSSGAYLGAATGNANFGYFGGGKHAPDPATPESRISRIDYSNDTAVSVIKGPLTAAKYSLAATGNASFGYFAGGNSPSPVVSTVERVDYSNDTATAEVKGPLSRTSYLMGATSAAANALPQ